MSLIKLDIVPTKKYIPSGAVVTTTKTPTTVQTTVAKTASSVQVVPQVEQDENTLNLLRMVAAQTTNNAIYNAEEIEIEEGKVTYLTASNGIFVLLRTPVAIFSECVQRFEQPLNHLYPMEEGFQLLIDRIDINHLLKALTYYKQVHTKDKTEASVLYFWNHTDDLDFTGELAAIANLPGLTVDGRLLIYCPLQKNSGALSDFEHDPWVAWFRTHTTCLLETHSHKSVHYI